MYLSYLPRLWPAGTGEGAAWRGSLEEIPAGERRVSAGLDDLVVYLRERMGPCPPTEEGAAREGIPPDPGDGAVPPAEKE